jgi:O-antigen/teichoic acid export membrane protein
MSVKQRIAQALAASAFGQVVTIGTQLLLTPLYFKYWGASLYGEWLILSSIPAYLTMVDLGIGSAAGNEMTMRAGAGDKKGAQQTYRGASLVASYAGLIVLILGIFLSWMTISMGVPKTTEMTPNLAGMLVLLLSINVALSFQGGVISAGFRAAGRNALGISLSNTSRLLESIAMAGALVANAGPLLLCSVALLVKCLMLFLQHAWLHKICRWLFHPHAPADRTLVRRLIVPSLGFMAFPLGNALALQGPILIIGHLLGAPAVAMFASMRTLARLPIQIANAFNSSVWPEMSRAHGAKDTSLLRRLHRSSWGVTCVLVLGSGMGLTIFGQWLTKIWLGPTAPFDQPVLGMLVVITVLTSLWNASSVVLSAINAHAELGGRYVITNGACVGAAVLTTAQFGWWGLLPMLVVPELVLLAWVLPTVLRLTQDKPNLFFRAATSGIWLQALAKIKWRQPK